MVTKKTPPPAPVVKKRGGARPGAGRPHGSISAKTAAVAKRILAGGDGVIPEGALELPDDATPLDVMVEAMRYSYRLAGPLGAFQYAKEAAPYLHARINAITLNNQQGADGEMKPFKFEVEFVNAKNGKPV